jgi:uncharacterized peroxidase-related enzyme
MTFIKVIQHEESKGELKSIYDNLVETRGKLAEVHKIQSLNPKSIVNHMELYMTIMFGKSPLKRYQREMIAVIVSVTNNCSYCKTHHGEALLHFWKEESKVKQLSEDYTNLDLSEVDLALCDYAKSLTKSPNSGKEKMLTDKLKDLGLEDRAILDAALVISYFNFVNRMVLGIGVHMEENAGQGYAYD